MHVHSINITIRGGRGSGKTVAARHVRKKLEKKGWVVTSVTSEQDDKDVCEVLEAKRYGNP